jgi:hypothetical protein
MSVPTLKLEVEELGRPSPASARPSRPASAGSTTPMAGLELLMKGHNVDPNAKKESVEDLAASLDQFVQRTPAAMPGPAPTLKIEPLAAVPQPAYAQPAQPPSQPEPSRSVRLNPVQPPSSVGQQTANAVRTETSDKSWDGFRPFGGGGIGAAAAGPAPPPKVQLTEAEILAEKFKYLRYLEALDKKPGITVSKKYDMKSSLEEMKVEYDLIKSECEKKQSMAFQSKMLMAAVTGLEFLNNKFDPFDLQLDGWGDSVNENITEYEDVFAELHEKYKSKASIAPEIKMMFLLAGSATMVHMTNTIFQPQLPGMDDLVQHNPELANRIAGAAADGLVSRGRQQAQPGRLPPPMQTARPHGGRSMPPPGTVQTAPRVEMRGPDNFDEIMSRVKRKNADAAVAPPQSIPAQPEPVRQVQTSGIRLAPPDVTEQRTVSIKNPTVLEGLQKAERTPVQPRGRKRKATEAGNVLKLEI